MESNPPEDSKSSTEDSDKKEHVNDDAGTGRFYECVFCKRGFTTAQALGGHMNIHRRDKAKNKHPTNSSSISKHFTRSGILHPDAGRPMFYSRAMDYFPSSDSSTVQSHRYDNSELHFQTPWDLNLLEDNPHTNLSLQTGPTYMDGHKKNKKQKAEEEDELDLELRLGHDP